MGLFDVFKKNKKQQDEKLDQSLEKTKSGFFSRLSKAVMGKSKIDDELLDELEEILLLSDVGVDTTVKIINRIRERVARDKYTSTDELNRILREEIVGLMQEGQSVEEPAAFDVPQPEENGEKVPYVILVVGVNGVGKTTTIGKLAHQFKESGRKVMLGAADTFRAAAVEQIRWWGQHVGVEVVDRGQNVDPGSVAYQAVQRAKQEAYDVVLIDTAGRLHNKKNLMDQLAKIKRVMTKEVAAAPHEVLLVLDASTGQNALQQAQEFMSVTEVTDIALTKLDGTAKGGVVIGISDRFKVPVKYVGVGEKLSDLQLFDPKVFVDSFFNQPAEAQEEAQG
jgi:fused signal recognition particle receptor